MMIGGRAVGIASLVAGVLVVLPSMIVTAQAPPRQEPLAPASPRFVPFDPKQPAIRREDELRKGAEGLQSGANPFPDFVKRVGPGLYEIGTVTLDLNVEQAKVPGRINMTRGIIEYLAVVDGRGKLHESVLALNVQPSMLQLALILMGLEAGEWAPPEPGTRRPPTFVTKGDPLVLFVEWEKDGKTERMAADTLVFNRETQQPLKGNRWNFTGSFFGSRGFAADVTGSIIATFFDYRAVLNVSQQVGNPYRGQNQGYEVNTSAVPPVDTPIRLVFERAPR
jgi:hypothetical protein